MSEASIQGSVAAKIKALYDISHDLEELFPGRHYTPDGHMIGSIGEALAASYYNLELFRLRKNARCQSAGWPFGADQSNTSQPCCSFQ